MPVYTSSIEVTADYPTIKPSLNLNFARSRSLDPRITFTRASTATYIGRDGLVRYAGVDEARFDHDPETLESLGLLIEESRTNVALYSSDFGNSGWAKNGGGNPATTVTTNQAIAPDGTLTADFIDYSTATVFSQNVERYIDLTPAGKTYTASIWIKGTPGQTINLILDGNGVGVAGEQFTLDGTWQRFSITRTYSPSFSVGALFRFGIRPLDLPAGTATQVYAWGAQVELGAFPTSYIPTSASAVTRAKDVAKITGTNFTNFYNTSEGTLYSSFIRNLQINGFLVGLGYDSNNYIGMGYTAGAGSNDVYVQPLVGSIFGHPSVGGNVKVKSIVSYSSSGASGCINGNTVVSETASGGLPSGSNGALYIGTSAYDPPTIGTGLISSVVYYPQRLTDAQLQLLTS